MSDRRPWCQWCQDWTDHEDRHCKRPSLSDVVGERDNLRAEVERLTAERDKAMTQRDALFHECEAMRQKTPPCIDCDTLRAERDRTEAALRDLSSHLRIVAGGMMEMSTTVRLMRDRGLWRDETKEDKTNG